MTMSLLRSIFLISFFCIKFVCASPVSPSNKQKQYKYDLKHASVKIGDNTYVWDKKYQIPGLDFYLYLSKDHKETFNITFIKNEIEYIPVTLTLDYQGNPSLSPHIKLQITFEVSESEKHEFFIKCGLNEPTLGCNTYPDSEIRSNVLILTNYR